MSSSTSSSSDVGIICVAAAAAIETATPTSTWQGPLEGIRPNLHRGECSWYRDYLDSYPFYPASYFRRRFRIPLSLFRKFERELPTIAPLLQQRIDAAQKKERPHGRKSYRHFVVLQTDAHSRLWMINQE